MRASRIWLSVSSPRIAYPRADDPFPEQPDQTTQRGNRTRRGAGYGNYKVASDPALRVETERSTEPPRMRRSSPAATTAARAIPYGHAIQRTCRSV
jgi:hypothetical protein